MSSGHHLLHAEKKYQALFKVLEDKTAVVTTEGSELHLCNVAGGARGCSPHPGCHRDLCLAPVPSMP